MITVHHLRPSRAERILWLLEEMEVPYEVETHDRDPATFRAPAALRDVHPLGKLPILCDGDVVVAESGAITEYLVGRYGPQLAPAADDPDRVAYLQWMHWSEGSMAAWLVMDLLVNGGMIPGVDAGPLGDMLPQEIATALDWVESELGDRTWAAGDRFTAADPMLTWVLEFARDRGHVGSRKGVTAYLERVAGRPAYQRAKERAA